MRVATSDRSRESSDLSKEVVEEQLQLAEFGFENIALLDGETIEATLELDNDEDGTSNEVILLTDRRVMNLNGNPKSLKAAFASIRDVEVVDIAIEREGIGAFVWAGLAFFVAIMLWRVIDHPLGSAVAGIVVAAMGIYLIVDHIMTPGRPVVTFKTGASEFRADLKSERAASEVYPFINRLFQLKDGSGAARYSSPSHFARR